jgi:hypothetical protein
VPNGVVLDDDRGITVVGLDDVSEGSNSIFTVTLPDGNTHDCQISLVLSDVTANSSDYNNSTKIAYYYDSSNNQVSLTITDGKIILPAGVSNFYVKVPTTSDNMYENAENFKLTATIVDGKSANDTSIIKDDGSGKVYNDIGENSSGIADDDRTSFAIADVSISEGGLMTFTVTRTGNAEVSQSVNFATTIETGNSSESGDFTSNNGTLTFATGETTKTFTVQTTVDSVYEGSETFSVTLSDATNGATISDNLAVGTIKDDGTGIGPFANGTNLADEA